MLAYLRLLLAKLKGFGKGAKIPLILLELIRVLISIQG